MTRNAEYYSNVVKGIPNTKPGCFGHCHGSDCFKCSWDKECKKELKKV